MTRSVLVSALVLIPLAACSGMRATAEAAPTNLDLTAYRDYVQPLMDVSCASLDCHGRMREPLRLYSADGLRIADGLRTTDPVDTQLLRDDEIAANVASLLAVDPYYMPYPGDSIVVKKPLAVAMGGIHHVGGELWPTTDDPAYLCVRDWLGGANEDNTAFTDECYLAITNVGGVPPPPPLTMMLPDGGVVRVDGGPPAPDAGPPPPVDAGMSTGTGPTWTTVYNTVLRPYCGGCHSGFRGSGGWNMGFSAATGYTSLVGVTARYCTSHARVTPYDAANSGLYMTLVGATCGSQMPPRSTLSAAQIAVVGDWINDGAFND